MEWMTRRSVWVKGSWLVLVWPFIPCLGDLWDVCEDQCFSIPNSTSNSVFFSFIIFTTIEIIHFLLHLLPRSVKEVLKSPGWLLNALSYLSLLHFFKWLAPQKFSPITPVPFLWHILDAETTTVKNLQVGEPDRSRYCPKFWTSTSDGDSELMKHASEGRQTTNPSPSCVDFTFSISVSLHL